MCKGSNAMGLRCCKAGQVRYCTDCSAVVNSLKEEGKGGRGGGMAGGDTGMGLGWDWQGASAGAVAVAGAGAEAGAGLKHVLGQSRPITAQQVKNKKAYAMHVRGARNAQLFGQNTSIYHSRVAHLV